MPIQVVDQRAADAAPACRLGGVHGLDLGVVVVDPLERGDAEQVAVDAVAEERHGGVDQRVDVERVDLLR